MAVITSPDDTALIELCGRLAEMASDLDRTGDWPGEQLRLCGEYGVYEWFLDPQWGGQAWSEQDIVRGYLALSAACLTTTFIITQRTGACRRLAGAEDDVLKQRWLPGLVRGSQFATVGISHLTTSRRHLARPVLFAERTGHGYVLEGYSPWVTGGAAADVIVLGATLLERGAPTERQLLVALPTDVPGVSIPPSADLVGLSASYTGPVHLDRVEVDDGCVIAGPVENVMAQGVGAGTGGHETSTLAIGLAAAAIKFLGTQAENRSDLQRPYAALREEHEQVQQDLLRHACGSPESSRETLRHRANSLALRASQAALTAAKGTGYVVGHPTGRWCREALFFLVWSCPQPVASASLCELAGIVE